MSEESPAHPVPLGQLEGGPLHTRSLTVAISRISDSVWRARGDVIDLRKTGFVTTHHDIQPSGVIHSMSITLDFDPISMLIAEVEVDQPHIAFDPSPESGGECCRDPAPRLLDFEGDHLDAGFTKRLSQQFGGPLGCSHLLTLFQLMASTVPLGVAEEQERAAREGTDAGAHGPFFRRNLFIDGHLRSDDRIDCAIQLADTHTRPIAPGDAFVEQLDSSHEWKLLATIDRKRFMIDVLTACERFRRASTLGSAPWEDHTELLSPLVATPILPGLAKRVFELLPEAATSTNVFGGSTNSCYMWRSGSPISKPYEDRRNEKND